MSTSPRGCEKCGARVAPRLMAFHREWHATQQGRGKQFWEATSDPTRYQLDAVVAALEFMRPISARPEFVADLRARLIAYVNLNNTSTR